MKSDISSEEKRKEHDLFRLVIESPPERQQALTTRISTFLNTVGHPSAATRDAHTLVSALDTVLTASGPHESWLAIAVLSGQLPVAADVKRLYRGVALGRASWELRQVLEQIWHADFVDGVTLAWPNVEVVTEQVLVDVHHTSSAGYATGIQRVAKQVVRQWNARHQVVLVGWDPRMRSLIALSDDLSRNLLEDGGSRSSLLPPRGEEPAPTLLVPWHSTVLVPELPADPPRATRLRAMFEYGETRSGLIGFDCVPLTAGETADSGMAYAFYCFLSAAGSANRVATISQAATKEYEGWKKMLAGSGRLGPEIRPVSLAAEVGAPDPALDDQARLRLGLGHLPIVLCVGSHEPRKNHLAVLHAAEVLWREDLDFALAFVGGNSWGSTTFEETVNDLQAVGRPLTVVRALSDDLLWGAYRAAHCTIFPSLHEGFGLPVAESLACGTPVITSSYGSMKELGQQGGTVLVDPRDDREIAAGLRHLLADHKVRDRLASEARNVVLPTWADYAADLWSYFVPD